MNNIDIHQILHLENRNKLTVDCVDDIGAFNGDYLEISTKFGCLCVEGADLKVEELRRDEARITVNGIINGLFYKDNKTSKGFLSGILK